MTFTLLTLLSLASLSSVPLDSNLVANPDFESGTTGWKFWANAADSGRIAAASDACHAGAGCLQLAHEGSKDWAVWPNLATVAVHPGEVWTWSAWTRARGPHLDAGLSFVTRDSVSGVLDWNASWTGVGEVGTGWTRTVSRLSIPKGCTSIQPRIVGYGLDSLWVDDATLVLESAAPTALAALSVSNDSVRLELDPYDLSMRLIEASGADTVRIGSLPDFHFDSAKVEAGALRIFVRHLAGGWNGQILSSLSGGSLRLSLTADSASSVPADFIFPGTVATRSGQRIAIPRGTGVAWPVDGPLSKQWPLTAARFWEWQVSQSVTGASDGKTGFVISIDQPSDARLDLQKGAGTLTSPVLRQTASKGVFGHERSAVIAALRGGGFAELARRHRERQDELGHIRNWKSKVADNPEVAKLRGATDWWVNSGFTWKSFDTLRWMGMENALIHWTPWLAKDLDSLRTRGWLMSVYDNWADAFPADTSPNGRENPTGAIVKKDGSTLNGWLEKHADGTTRQALEICSARHPHLAQANAAADAWTLRRNARFIDVEMAVNLQECWSPDHPVDRQHDLENRVRALSVIKDSLHLVTGSEQAREASFAHVDYGEGSMSIASVGDAGYDWSTPEAPEGMMDSLFPWIRRSACRCCLSRATMPSRRAGTPAMASRRCLLVGTTRTRGTCFMRPCP
jgi:Glycosyl hydrolases related to GH101 family, GH129/Carbohydrate binding domain